MDKKIIGILGGMGPLATADLYKKIVELTDAKKDQDHIRVIIDSNINIPDRTAAILGDGNSPKEELQRSARLLEKAGADFLIMPCNTAHHFLPVVEEAVEIPVVSIIESAASEVIRKTDEADCDKKNDYKALILATDGTKNSKVYGNVFHKRGIETIYPDEKMQAKVMSIIYEGIKAGTPKAGRMEEIVTELNAYIETMGMIAVLACTELPLAVEQYGLKGDFVDATESLAKAAIVEAGYDVKKSY